MKKVQWLRLLSGLIAVFALFQWIAITLGSDRGQAGVIVGVVVVAGTLLVEMYLFRKSFKESARAIGLARMSKIGVLTATAISVFMLLMIIVFGSVTDSALGLYPNWYWLVPGLFFQAGIAEETLFRGYLFNHLRRKYAFWKAATLAALPFTVVHLILFQSLAWSIAFASILLAIVMSFPLSRLYELGAQTIWAPAIVHFVTQGAVKVVVVSGKSASLFPFFWMTICALVPLSVFAIEVRKVSEPQAVAAGS